MVTPGQLNRRAELYHQLSSTISAGIPLIKALEMASANPAVRASRKTFRELIQRLQSGQTFAESMTQSQGWLPEFDIALLRVGESSGRLDVSFRLLADYYAVRAKIIRDTLAELVVTAATLHVFLLVFPLRLWMAFAQGIYYSDYGRCVPFLIEKVVAFGILYGSVFFLIFASQGQRGEPWRALVESFAVPIPFLGTARKYLALSRLAVALEALVSAGVSVIKSWELAGAACGSPRLRREISSWNAEFESGSTPAELVNRSSCFPGIFANLYSTGELSGTLDDALGRLRTYFQEEGFRALRAFTRIMNGTLYGLVVLLVAYNVIGFWMRYFGQISTITSGF